MKEKYWNDKRSTDKKDRQIQYVVMVGMIAKVDMGNIKKNRTIKINSGKSGAKARSEALTKRTTTYNR